MTSLGHHCFTLERAGWAVTLKTEGDAQRPGLHSQTLQAVCAGRVLCCFPCFSSTEQRSHASSRNLSPSGCPAVRLWESQDPFSRPQVVELKLGGKDIPVTSANRIAYIHLVADYRLNRQIRQHCLAFRQGLANVLSLEWLRMFDQQEIQVHCPRPSREGGLVICLQSYKPVFSFRY